MDINFSRVWAMPNKNTFSIKPIKEFILRVTEEKANQEGSVIIDPFANNSCLNHICTHTNDLDPEMDTTHHMDALDFLKTFDDNSVDVVLYDPPYSPRQVSECYKAMGRTVNMETTQASFWGNLKKEIARITKDGAVVVSCGWNSGGIGKKLNFVQTDILLVPHGGNHNDTIVVAEVKRES